MDSSRVRFAGYAAIFDRPDKGGDVIRPGAFAGSLGSGEAVPLLWQHKAGAVIGRIEHLSEARGACYVVASGATGAWAGKDDMLAGYADGGWRFVAPVEGLRPLDRGSGQILLRRDGAWESGIVRAEEVQIGGLTVVRQRQPAIANPTGGTVIDAECRTAIGSILTMLRTHGLIAS